MSINELPRVEYPLIGRIAGTFGKASSWLFLLPRDQGLIERSIGLGSGRDAAWSFGLCRNSCNISLVVLTFFYLKLKASVTALTRILIWSEPVVDFLPIEDVRTRLSGPRSECRVSCLYFLLVWIPPCFYWWTFYKVKRVSRSFLISILQSKWPFSKLN